MRHMLAGKMRLHFLSDPANEPLRSVRTPATVIDVALLLMLVAGGNLEPTTARDT